MESTGTVGTPGTYKTELYESCIKAIGTARKIFTVGTKILVGMGCFASQPNLAFIVAAMSFCEPGIAENVRGNMETISQLFTWKKAKYAALVLFLAWYALPVTHGMCTGYLAIQLGITLRKQLDQVEES